MKNLKRIFIKILGTVKWWEWTYLSMAFATLLIMGIIFKSGAISILFSLFNIFTIFALGKGWIWGNVVGVVASSLYVAMCFSSRLYGEVIMSLVFAIPTYLLCTFAWMKNSHKQTAVVQVNKKISWQEWLISSSCIAVFGVGIYYFLEYFDTAFLLVSTFSATICFLARYMQMRRSEFNFVCYIFANAIGIVLWAYVSTIDISCITTVITYVVQALMNVVAFINWVNMRRKQNQDDSFEIIKKCCS